jgi:hypothetical protein
MTQLITVQNTAGIQVDIVPVVEALADSFPEMENIDDIITSIDEKSKRDISMLERGQIPEIKIRDAHQDLISAVNVYYSEHEATYPEEIKQTFEDYIVKHMKYIQSEKEIQAMSQPMIPQGNNAGNLQNQMGATTQGTVEGLPGGGNQNLSPLVA